MAQNHLIQIFLLRRKLQREQKKTEQLEQELWDTRQVPFWAAFFVSKKLDGFCWGKLDKKIAGFHLGIRSAFDDKKHLETDETKDNQRESI